jgi:hypothetical protein
VAVIQNLDSELSATGLLFPMAMASPSLVGARPQRTREVASSRDSNALRASVLDVALELGIGTSRAVENLIFDSILEEDEVSFPVALPAFSFLCLIHRVPSFAFFHHEWKP